MNHFIKVMCRKFECRQDIHYKTQTGTSCEKYNSKAFGSYNVYLKLTTLEFPTHNFDFHLLTTSENAKYYY